MKKSDAKQARAEFDAPPTSGIITTVDSVLLTVHEQQLKVALFPREHDPFAGQATLSGRYLRTTDKNALFAAAHSLKEKTGIVTPYLEQLYTFSGPDRDPRGYSVSIAHYALVPCQLILDAAPAGMELRSVDDRRKLPFDHSDIVAMAVSRVRNKSQYSSLPLYLAPEKFSQTELQRIYEHVMGTTLPKAQFRRKLAEMDVLEETGEQEQGVAHKPAWLYRLKPGIGMELSLLKRGL